MSDVTRTISKTHRELNEKKGIVVENLKKLQEEQASELEDGKEAQDSDSSQSDTSPKDQRPKGPPPSEALKVFFDRIPLSSIPGLNHGQVLEVGSKDCIGDAIKRLYEANVMGAPVCDDVGIEGGGDRSTTTETDPYIGLIELSSLVLWALQELEKADVEGRKRGLGSRDTDSRFVKGEQKGAEESGFFKNLRQHFSVWDTKVAVMARSFRWGPFLPIRPEDTLLHALLMLSKHSLKAVPVMNSSNKNVMGFITQDTALTLLLQCGGLEWFDAIADKKLSEFKFEIDEGTQDFLQVDSKSTVIDATTYMWKHRVGGMPIIDKQSQKIVGNIRTTDVRLVLDSCEVFEKRRSMTLEELMKIDAEQIENCSHKEDDNLNVIISAAALQLKKGWRPKMADVVTCSSSDSLKHLMTKLAETRADRGFLVDENMRMVGLVSLRDIVIQFAPPLIQLTATPGFFHA